jgi:hypothetical protein
MEELHMGKSIIQKIHMDFKETKNFTLPEDLLPPDKGYILLKWVRELFIYYQEEDIVVRAFDDLPPLKLSQQEGLDTTIQDVHKFIINDLNLIPLETRKSVVEHAVSHPSSQQAWQSIAALLLDHMRNHDKETAMEDLTWKFSPVAEILWVVTWFFMERENVVPPQSIHLISSRFPYYLWLTEEKKQSLWEPENPLCRWERLALDLYDKWRNPKKC